MKINFDKNIYGIRSGIYINKRINIINQVRCKSLNKKILDKFLNSNSNKENEVLQIYLGYMYNDKFEDKIYNYIWIKVNKNYLINIKNNKYLYY